MLGFTRQLLCSTVAIAVLVCQFYCACQGASDAVGVFGTVPAGTNDLAPMSSEGGHCAKRRDADTCHGSVASVESTRDSAPVPRTPERMPEPMPDKPCEDDGGGECPPGSNCPHCSTLLFAVDGSNVGAGATHGIEFDSALDAVAAPTPGTTPVIQALLRRSAVPADRASSTLLRLHCALNT